MSQIGNDIVDIERIRTIINEKGQKFLDHVFTEDEIDYCSKCADPPVHFAGRFAGKEAVKKAILAAHPQEIIPLNIIQIHRCDDGAPFVSINKNYNFKIEIHLSISHTVEYATAVALVEEK